MANKKKAVVVGYATNDYVLELAAPFTGVGTTAVKQRCGSGWPRSGGAALYASMQLARFGHVAAPITWVGGDESAKRYLRACEEAGVVTTGIASFRDGKTPTCLLMYQPDGEYGCLFDSGLSGSERLLEPQRELVRSADLVLFAIGPADIGMELLESVREDALVGWIAKDDKESWPADVCARYAARADYIFCNAGERAFVEASIGPPGSVKPVIFETRGSAGVFVEGADVSSLISTSAIDAPDATGAGDTFAGATMASVLTGVATIEESARCGVTAAGKLLASRAR